MWLPVPVTVPKRRNQTGIYSPGRSIRIIIGSADLRPMVGGTVLQALFRALLSI